MTLSIYCQPEMAAKPLASSLLYIFTNLQMVIGHYFKIIFINVFVLLASPEKSIFCTPLIDWSNNIILFDVVRFNQKLENEMLK
jgi:hypothetical protein